ncbi:hypothetical protein BWO91_02660 [Plantibacter flavus]|uniref:hypothetical protein n=1 Tax=Plantibacter flavus TaxID=150123 RepID=UPI00099E0DFF|nr:hypothetical protein [Plantibacter flavus]AQX79036.1 hypothetical protein BWO91_02660 [Plantibacter flavus]
MLSEVLSEEELAGDEGLRLIEVLDQSAAQERHIDLTRHVDAVAGTEYVEQTGRIRVDITVYEFQGGDGYSQSTETHYIDDVKRKAPTGHFETGQDNVPCCEDFQVPVG